MLVKIEDFVVESKNKDALVRIANEFLNQYIHIEYIATPEGEIRWDDGEELELVRGTDYLRKRTFFLKYYGIFTPYGIYSDAEISAYKNAQKLCLKFSEMEAKFAEAGVLIDTELKESEISLDLPKPAAIKFSCQDADKSRECFKLIGVEIDADDDELNYLYHECLWEHFEKKKPRYEMEFVQIRRSLIDRGELDRARQKYRYMRDVFPIVSKEQIEKEKQKLLNC